MTALHINPPSNPLVNPALLNNSAEFFAHNGKLNCLHNGKTYTYQDTPEHLKAKVAEHLSGNAAALKALKKWQKSEPIDVVEQYAICVAGGMDHEADFDEQGNFIANEYYDCGKRGRCEYEGKICPCLNIEGALLTQAEMRLFVFLHKANKDIASMLHRSEKTINAHVQNMCIKTGKTRSGLIAWGAKKGIIKP